MPDTEKNRRLNNDIIEKAPHYNTRSIEAINFIRHMDFALGNAFKYVWRFGLKDVTDLEKGKRNYYIRDALVHRPAFVGSDITTHLTRVLSTVADEFSAAQFEMLISLIWAASGDYDMLISRAKQLELFPAPVGEYVLR